MFETKINGSLMTNAYTNLMRQIRWRWNLLNKIGDEDYDLNFEVKDKDNEKIPPYTLQHIEAGLAAGQE
jgi:hypothetical protein